MGLRTSNHPVDGERTDQIRRAGAALRAQARRAGAVDVPRRVVDQERPLGARTQADEGPREALRRRLHRPERARKDRRVEASVDLRQPTGKAMPEERPIVREQRRAGMHARDVDEIEHPSGGWASDNGPFCLSG